MSAWSLSVPNKGTTTAAKTGAGSAINSGRINLLKNDAPTKMVPWELQTIRVPVEFLAIPTVEPTSLEVIGTLILRRGGDIVWSQTLSIAMQKEGAKQWSATVVMGADLQNPIDLPTGKTLTLELIGIFAVETDPNTTVEISVERVGGSVFVSEGSIAYRTRELSGHRVL